MKNDHIKSIMLCLIFATQLELGQSQGFSNLDFENPILPLTPSNSRVPIANALPGWTGYAGGAQVDEVLFDTVSLGAAAVSFHDTNGYISLQGVYCAGIQSSDPGSQFMAALAQIGQIPQDAQSIRFIASPFNTLQLSFAGQPIPLFQIGGGSGYEVLAGDISAFASQTGELRFTSGTGPLGHGGAGFLDDIRFSNQSVPEPSVLGLFALVGALLGWLAWHRQQA